MNYSYVTDISSSVNELDEKNNQTWIELHRLGKWYHPEHGWIKGTKKMFENMIKNWKENVLGRDIIFDKNHKPNDGGTAELKDMKIDNDRLKGLVQFTPFGLELIKNKSFKYFSPEYRDDYVVKETRKKVGPTLLGGALTLRPFLTNLHPIVLSENIESQCYTKCQDDEVIESVVSEVVNEMAIEKGLSKEEFVGKIIKKYVTKEESI